jgi:hypothetical protein
VSEIETSGSHDAYDSARRPTGPVSDHVIARPVPDREGLPHNYRMRADAHYVEQLEAPAHPVVRMLATRQIDCREMPAADRLDALTRSIAAHGIVQPLIVRRQTGRFQLIAGRKRLAAAMAAGLTTVPCLLHDVEDAAAAALTEAENLRVEPAPATRSDGDAVQSVLQALSADLSAIAASASLLHTPRTSALTGQVAGDLIQAQAWRAAWLAASATGALEPSRPAPVAAVVQRVAAGFAPQARLNALRLDTSIAPGAAAWPLDEELTVRALTGCVFATLAWLEGIPQPHVELRVDAPIPRALKIEVIQRAAAVPAGLARYLMEDHVRPADLVPAIALRAIKAVAALQGGRVEIVAIPGRGSVIQTAFAKATA